jgi:hypothetical protein
VGKNDDDLTEAPLDWKSRMNAPYELTFAEIEGMAAGLIAVGTEFEGTETLNFEKRVLVRLVYRNVSQHRRGRAFQRLRRVLRTLEQLDGLDVPGVVARLHDGLPVAPSVVRALQLPAYPAFRAVLRTLVGAARLLKAAVGMCRQAFVACCSDLGNALFMPLNLTCGAVVSRLGELLGKQLKVVIAGYKSLALCTTWSSSPDNHSGSRREATTPGRGASSSASAAVVTGFFGVPGDFDAWLALQPAFDDGIGPSSAHRGNGTAVGSRKMAGASPRSSHTDAAADVGRAGVVVTRLDYRRTSAAPTRGTNTAVSVAPLQALQAAVEDSLSESEGGSDADVVTGTRPIAIAIASAAPVAIQPRVDPAVQSQTARILTAKTTKPQPPSTPIDEAAVPPRGKKRKKKKKASGRDDAPKSEDAASIASAQNGKSGAIKPTPAATNLKPPSASTKKKLAKRPRKEKASVSDEMDALFDDF